MSDAGRWVHTDESSQLISGTLNKDRRALMEEIAKETTAQRKPQLDEEPQLGDGQCGRNCSAYKIWDGPGAWQSGVREKNGAGNQAPSEDLCTAWSAFLCPTLVHAQSCQDCLPWAQRNVPSQGRNWSAGVQTQSTGYSCWNEDWGAEP